MKNRKLTFTLSLAAIVGIVGLTGCNRTPDGSSSLDPTLEGTYTLHEATSGSPEKWSPATWETNEDSLVTGYTELGLIDYVLNDEKNGYEAVPEMAAEIPTDVTSSLTKEEAVKYDMNMNGENLFTTGQKWQIKLNQAAKFEDGTQINADTYINSLRDILDPEMQNFRAGDFANGTTAIAGGLHYLQSGQTLLEGYIDADGLAHTGTPVKEGWYFNAYAANSWWASMSFASLCGYLEGDALTAAQALLADTDTFGTSSEPKVVRLDNNAELCKKVYEVANNIQKSAFGLSEGALTNNFVEGNVGETGPYSMATWCFRYYKYAEYDFANVGIQKVDDFTFNLFFKSPVSSFDAKLFFSSNWIVKQDLWDSLRKPVADSGLYTTTYGTSKDTYAAFGPYKLSAFQADKQIDFERNEKWYGYSDGKHEDEFQVDKIEVKVVQNEDTMLSLFRTGEIDSYNLRSKDLDILGSSSRLLYTPQSYTTKLSVNSVYESLLEAQKNDTKGNHTILSNQKFRKALSLGLDRKTLCQTQTAGWRGFDVPINFMYVSDPETGVAYRDTEQGKKVVTDNFGTDSDGEPNYYGYDLAEARKLIDEAVAEEAASTKEGHYEEGQTVHLVWESYNSGWDDMVNWVINAYKELVKGTKLEGKLDIEVKITGSDYADHIRNGTCDFGISTWGGAQFDPFGILECYTISSKMYETYNIYQDYLEINLKTGEWSDKKGGLAKSNDVVGMTLGGDGSGTQEGNWTYELTTGEYSSALCDATTRLNILSACESYIVGTYNFISWGARQSVSLDSYRVSEGTDEYVQIVGFGGIRKLKLTKTDADWSNWVKANLGKDGFIDYNK